MDSSNIGNGSPHTDDTKATPTQNIQEKVNRLSRIIADQDCINGVLKTEKMKLENYLRDESYSVKEIFGSNHGSIQQDHCPDTYTKLDVVVLENTSNQELSSKEVQQTQTLNRHQQKITIAEKSEIKQSTTSKQIEQAQTIADYQEKIDTIMLENAQLRIEIARRDTEQAQKVSECMKRLEATLLENKNLRQKMGCKDEDVEQLQATNKCHKRIETTNRETAATKKEKTRKITKQNQKSNEWQGHLNATMYENTKLTHEMAIKKQEHAQRINEYQEELHKVMRKNDELKEKDIEHAQRISEYQKKLHTAMRENDELKEKDKEQAQRISEYQEKIHTAVRENDELKAKDKEHARRINEYEEKLQTAMRENDKLKEKEKEHAQRISGYQEQLETAMRENDKLKEKANNQEIMYHKEIQIYRTKLETANNDVRQVKISVKTLEITCQELQERLKQKETVHVLLYYVAHCTLINKVSTNLKAKLTAQMEELAINIEIDACDEPQSRSPKLPLIVLCIQSSRLGTDVAIALKNITYERTVVLVIVHNKPSHALPSYQSERILTDSEYKKLGLIVDIAYFSEDGMYSCDMNEKSLTRLCEFLKLFQ